MINKSSAQWLISQRLTIHTQIDRGSHTALRALTQRHLSPTVSSHSFARECLWASVFPSVQWGEMLHDPDLAMVTKELAH